MPRSVLGRSADRGEHSPAVADFSAWSIVRRSRNAGHRGGTMGQVTVYRDAAVVLRVTKLGEADRIVTLLTRREGRVRAVAKGVRRTKSKFGGRLEPFSH